MWVNKAKAKMLRGEPAIGAGARLGDPLAAELLALAGYDFIMVDDQHGAWDDTKAMAAFRSILLAGSVPMVRVRHNDFAAIGNMLDRGAIGIVVPLVNTREDAERAAEACRYPPRGGRSEGPFGCGIYGPDYHSWADDQVLLMVQIETIQAVENAAEILSVEGVDGCWIGPADMAASMGTAQGTPEHEEAVQRALRACLSEGKIPGYACGHDARARIAEGFLYIRSGADETYMLESAREWLAANRGE
jgi:4-hydroxy-2-oxoheptanedioate aldolase